MLNPTKFFACPFRLESASSKLKMLLPKLPFQFFAPLLWYLPVFLYGQGHAGLDGSLLSYLQQAQAHNPGLQAARKVYDAAKERIPQAAALPDPMFQVAHFVESVQTRTGPQENVYMLSQKFPLPGKRSGKEELAHSEAQAFWYAFQHRQLQLARQVALGYYEYGYTAEAVRLTSESITLLKKLEPIVEQKVTVGAPLNSFLRLKVEIGKMEDRRQTLLQEQHIQSAKLRELLGHSGEGDLAWPEWKNPDLFVPDVDSLAQGLRENNPELLMLRQDIQSAGTRADLAGLANYPDITLGVNYVDLGGMEGNPSMAIPQKDPWAVTLSINLPIWKEKIHSAMAEAQSLKDAADKKYESRRLALGTEMAVALAYLEDANRRVQLYGNELLDLAKQAVENTQASYENGKSGILDLIDSERSLLDIQLLHRRAACDAWKQRSNLQTLANQPLFHPSPSPLPTPDAEQP